MIRINLLTGTEKKGKARGAAAMRRPASNSGGGPIVALVALVFLGVDGFAGYKSFTKVSAAKKAFAEKQEELKKTKDEVVQYGKEAADIQNMNDILTNQWEVLQSIDPPDRLLWSEKLNMLAKLIPSNVFLTEIEVLEDFKEVEIQSSVDARAKWEAEGKRGEKPEVVKKPVITYTLRLTGLATGADNTEQLDNVWKFHEALVRHETTDSTGQRRRFMDGFSPNIDFEYVESTLYERQYPVQQFTFKLMTKPLEADAKESLGGEAPTKARGRKTTG